MSVAPHVPPNAHGNDEPTTRDTTETPKSQDSVTNVDPWDQRLSDFIHVRQHIVHELCNTVTLVLKNQSAPLRAPTQDPSPTYDIRLLFTVEDRDNNNPKTPPHRLDTLSPSAYDQSDYDHNVHDVSSIPHDPNMLPPVTWIDASDLMEWIRPDLYLDHAKSAHAHEVDSKTTSFIWQLCLQVTPVTFHTWVLHRFDGVGSRQRCNMVLVMEPNSQCHVIFHSLELVVAKVLNSLVDRVMRMYHMNSDSNWLIHGRVPSAGVNPHAALLDEDDAIRQSFIAEAERVGLAEQKWYDEGGDIGQEYDQISTQCQSWMKDIRRYDALQTDARRSAMAFCATSHVRPFMESSQDICTQLWTQRRYHLRTLDASGINMAPSYHPVYTKNELSQPGILDDFSKAMVIRNITLDNIASLYDAAYHIVMTLYQS